MCFDKLIRYFLISTTKDPCIIIPLFCFIQTKSLQLQRRLRGERGKLTRSYYKCYEPSKKETAKPVEPYFQVLENKNNIINMNDIVWTMLKTLSPLLSSKVPTWAAYNSLIASVPTTTTVAMLPIVNGSPTKWENLYTAIKEAEKIVVI